jgi:hypothetical protein
VQSIRQVLYASACAREKCQQQKGIGRALRAQTESVDEGINKLLKYFWPIVRLYLYTNASKAFHGGECFQAVATEQ